jgi:hypothetical protein
LGYILHALDICLKLAKKELNPVALYPTDITVILHARYSIAQLASAKGVICSCTIITNYCVLTRILHRTISVVNIVMR